MINKLKYNELTEHCRERNASLVAVSKNQPGTKILELYEMGHRVFGENRVQELCEKHYGLPKDIEWHLIGHLQTNKVKQVVPFVHLIHSVDSLKLIKEISKQATKEKKLVNVLLQIAIAKEDTKFGLDGPEMDELLQWYISEKPKYVQILGFMGMATYTYDDQIVKTEFEYLKTLFEKTKQTYDLGDKFKEISMGMSGDYHIALDAGSTMIRIGSSIFGSRD